jgi:hypothetical protein
LFIPTLNIPKGVQFYQISDNIIFYNHNQCYPGKLSDLAPPGISTSIVVFSVTTRAALRLKSGVRKISITPPDCDITDIHIVNDDPRKIIAWNSPIKMDQPQDDE